MRVEEASDTNPASAAAGGCRRAGGQAELAAPEGAAGRRGLEVKSTGWKTVTHAASGDSRGAALSPPVFPTFTAYHSQL